MPIVRMVEYEEASPEVRAVYDVLAVVGLFNTTNKLAEGYQVEPDVFPPLE